jgi:hypothetical protein
MYILKIIICLIIFPFFFPIIATFIPQYDLLFGFEGEYFVFPISLHRDTSNITKKMQSKLFWYYTFKRNKILTPKVYYYFNNMIYPSQKMIYLLLNLNMEQKVQT